MLSQDFDVDSFSHIRQSSLRQTHQTCWHLMATTSICVVDILEILYLSLHFSLRDMATCCFSSITVPEPSTTEQNPSSLPSEPRRRAYIPNKTILRRISLHDSLITTSQLIALQYASFNHYHCHTTVTNSLLSLLYHALVNAE